MERHDDESSDVVASSSQELRNSEEIGLQFVEEHLDSLDDGPNSRAMGSLVLLTRKFVRLMRARGGEVDLKTATTLLDVQKRRIYDITNVLEGVGLIEKTRHTSTVRWRGDFGCKRELAVLQSALLRRKHLTSLEADLDIQLDYARRNFKHIKEDALESSFAYITRDDLLSVYGDDVVFTVPKQDEEMSVKSTKKDVKLLLENGGSIDVRLVTDQGECIKHVKRKNHIVNSQEIQTTSAAKSIKADEHDNNEPALDTPSTSPTSFNGSSNHSATEVDNTASLLLAAKNLVQNEHTYFCNPELKEKSEQIERETEARIILRNRNAGHSLRRFFPDDRNETGKPPLMPVNPPSRDFNFALKPNEGICELFDIPYPTPLTPKQ